MQDTILRVFVVVAGLIMYPREDLRVQDLDADVTMDVREPGDLLVKEWLDQEITPVNLEVPKDRDELESGKPSEPQADQRVAETEHSFSQDGPEDTRVSLTHSEEGEEEEKLHQDEDDSDRNLTTSVYQREPQTDSAPSLMEQQAAQDQTQPDVAADASPVDEEQQHPSEKEMSFVDQQFSENLQEDQTQPDMAADASPVEEEQQQQPSEKELPLVDQQFSEDIQEGRGLDDHQIRPESEGVVEMDPEEPKEDQEVHLADMLTEPSLEDQREVVETYQEVLHKDKEAPLPQVYPEPSEEDQGGHKQVTDTENTYIWYLWNTYSVIAFINFLIKYFRNKSQKNQSKDLPDRGTDILKESKLAAEISLPDSDTLNRFYDKCVKVSREESRRVREFVEGFADDLMEAMKTMSDRAVGMLMEDYVVVGGVLNSLVFDVIVPLTPLDPYRFQYQLWCSQAGDIPDMEGCGRIKMEEGVLKQNGCPCGNSGLDNILCLLHSENEMVNVRLSDSPLWSQTYPYLSKAQVTKWFQNEIRQAWGQISHKYEFELTFRNTDAPGALTVRFRSGKVITFNIKPVVKFEDTDMYFTVSPSTSKEKEKSSDTLWGLSLTMHEDQFLKHVAKSLPENTCHLKCLETAVFLHKMQSRLTGRCGLTDYHFKTALLHLLVREHSEWHPQHFTSRLRDLLEVLEKSLQHRKLHQAFIGNPLDANDKSLSGKFGDMKAVNLFHPLVVQNSLYTKTLHHFQEMLKNSFLLIWEHVPKGIPVKSN